MSCHVYQGIEQDAGPPFIQSVSKVTCCPDGRWLPDADPQVLALNYPKTMAAAVAAALRVLQTKQPKILVIGLGPEQQAIRAFL